MRGDHAQGRARFGAAWLEATATIWTPIPRGHQFPQAAELLQLKE